MFIVIDVGATNTRIAASRDLETFDDPLIFTTAKTYEEGLQVLVEKIRALAGEERVEGISIGVPGVLTRDKRFLLQASNLPGWAQKNVVYELELAFGSLVCMDNDTALVGLGEAVFGAGKGAEIVVYITISTGVNGVRVVRGVVDPSAQGFEISYQLLNVDNTAEKWGDMISGRSIEQTFGKHPKELGKDNPIWEDLAKVAAQGIHNSILHWSPDRVVVGGSMTNEIGISVPRIHEHVKEMLKAFPQTPDIVHSQLGDVGGLWGGLALIKQRV